MKTKFHDDLDWFAFLYVSNELNDQERQQFEELLSDDQAAREAVARSVELTTTVAAAYRVSVAVGSSPHWLRNAGLIALGAAACLFLVFLVGRFGADSVATRPTAEPDSSHELAILWSETREGWTDDEASGSQLSVVDETNDGWAETENGDDSDDAISTPSWMLVAVSDLSEELTEEDPTIQEN